MATIYYIENNKTSDIMIEKLLSRADFTCIGFQESRAFFKKFQQIKPDLVLLDMMLPLVSGLDILKDIRKYDKDIPIIMISASQSEMDKVIALDMGANDYMKKPFGPVELIARIQSKLRKSIDDRVYHLGNLLIDDKNHIFMINNQKIYLTNKEFSILKLLLKNKNQVVSKEAIFKDVWETDFIGETRSLDMHIKSLRQKISEQTEVRIKTIRGIGYSIE